MNEFDRNNYEYWKWGIFYNNPNDSSIWVPKRTGLGWTLNFAHRVSYLIMALLVVVPLFIGLVSGGLLKF
jgi:uncharacterized membrane protein